jgi:hypothetical protein
MGGALERARRDVEENRLWKARDRLGGALVSTPTDPEVLDLLGEVYFLMGDLPRAGAVWMLTERDDDRSRAAIQALREQHGGDARLIVRALPLKAPLADYPATVAGRVRTLAREAELDPERIHARSPGAEARRSSACFDACSCLGCGGIAVFLIVALCLGAGELMVLAQQYLFP